MHASTTSIEVTALWNVHRFFSSSTQINIDIKLILHEHCSSCNINFPSIATNKPQKWIHKIAKHPYNLVTATRKKSCCIRKCMVHITNRRWSIQPLHLVVLTRFPRWYYKTLPVISTWKILLKTILTTRFLVTVFSGYKMCDNWSRSNLLFKRKRKKKDFWRTVSNSHWTGLDLNLGSLSFLSIYSYICLTT